MSRDTGGPAFPSDNGETGCGLSKRIGVGQNGEAIWTNLSEGMTLRDYFAAKAMNGLMASYGEHDVSDYDEIAADAYRLADAMIAAMKV